MAVNHWQPAPLWVLLVPVLVVRTSFVLSPPSLHGLGQDVEREVLQLLEPHGEPHMFVELCFRL
jgi:hypothetical protein